MKRWQSIALVLVISAATVLAICYGWSKHLQRKQEAAHQREVGYETMLRSYSTIITPGISRRQVEGLLHKRGDRFIGFPAYSEDSAYADLIKIAEEKDGWYCGPGSVNVAIRFETATNRRSSQDPSDNVKGVTLFKLFQDCM
ncbi:MAG: hypothetical protein ABR987_02945 [Terracidiphilus sp.]|jgi:hypothetical protein